MSTQDQPTATTAMMRTRREFDCDVATAAIYLRGQPTWSRTLAQTSAGHFASDPCERSRSFANSAHGWYWLRYASPAPPVSPAPRSSEQVTRSPIVCETLKK